MAACLFAFIACLLAAIGARDQMLVAGLTARLGRHGGLLATALATGGIASLFAVLAARELSGALDPAARPLMASFALAIAGMESLLLGPRRPPREPTRSLGAAAIVLLADQILDSARLLLLAVALVSGSGLAAGVGGAAGNGAALVLGWLGADLLPSERIDGRGHGQLHGRLRLARKAAGLALLLAAALLGLWTLRVIGAN